MLTALLGELVTGEAADLVVAAGESVVSKIRIERDWKKVFVDTGKFFIEHEQYADQIFEDLAEILSKENMTRLANELKSQTGYGLKDRLLTLLMNLMAKYEIPHETAYSYAHGILYTILGQIQEIAPEKYDRYFQEEWRKEQAKVLEEISAKIERVDKELTECRERQIEIYSADEMDILLKRSTVNPQIGVDYFCIDDESFKALFSEYRSRECVYVKARCREEAIYCIINELWNMNDSRAIFVVQNKEDWERLHHISASENIYIPWFYADEITAIKGNTNIFVLTDDSPAFSNDVIELRPRTHSTLAHCLQRAGLEINDANTLIAETHGLYIPMKKKIFNGAYLKKPEWLTGLPEEIKKVCLLVGQWTEADGDKAVIETLSGLKYDEFMQLVLPFTKGEDPLVHVVKRHQNKTYFLACVENTWEYMTISIEDPMWKKFIQVFTEVLNESEGLFIYSVEERMVAQFKGEKLFWSQSIRNGMLRTLIMKAYYRKDEECQWALDKLVEEILGYIKNEKQWKYISSFFTDLCEVSPKVIIKRLQAELLDSTGLLQLFEKQSGDLIFGRNDYIEILWGVEEFLVQREFAAEGLKWLLSLDNLSYEYKSNSPKDSIRKVFFPWYNFSAFQTSEEKISAAEMAFEYDKNAWEHIYKMLSGHNGGIIGELHSPKYRDHECVTVVSSDERKRVILSYIELLIKHADFCPERWGKLLKVADEMTPELKKRVFKAMLYEVSQMSDMEMIQVKNAIRDIIYRHRYFASASWAMPEEEVLLYEELLSEIHTVQMEYEYEYLFRTDGKYPILHPIPYDQEGKREENEKIMQNLISEKLIEFQSLNLDLKILSDICGQAKSTTLGRNLALYWKNSEYDRNTFITLINSQKSGIMALEYYQGFALKKSVSFEEVLKTVNSLKCSDGFIAGLYRVEACYATDIPKVDSAGENIKRLFWMNPWIHIGEHYEWALSECKRFGTINSFLELLYRICEQHNLNKESVYNYLLEIKKMKPGVDILNIEFYLSELLKPLQAEYLYDSDKCMKIAEIEFMFFNVINWENMRCFQFEIKSSPDLFAEMVSIIYKKENDEPENRELTEQEHNYINNIHMLFDKAKFCPAEVNGEVNKKELKKWIERLILLLKKNKQSGLLGFLLGRLLSFSPVGRDNHRPCEAVREMIEIYADDSLISEYQVSVFNGRGMHSPSAGKEELRMAEKFKENAEYLSVKYPRTAEIYYGLYHSYKEDSDSERERAENGCFF